MLDIEKLIGAVHEYVERAVRPLAEQLAVLREQLAAAPTPKDGTSVTPADVEPMLRRMVDEIPRPKDAESLDPEAVASDAAAMLLRSEGLKAICDLVAGEAVAALPPAEKGEPGQSVTVEEVVAKLLPGLEDRFEAIVARHVLDIERRAQGVLERAAAAIPKPENGKDGRDGIDGLGFDDMRASYDGERGVTLTFQRGEQVKTFSFALPVVIDRGYWREGTDAKAGDGWTHDGTWWIATKDTREKPNASSSDWRIGARKGRDGDRGPAGKDYKPDGPVML